MALAMSASASAAALVLWCFAIWAVSVGAADANDLVTALPGQPPVSFKHYAGQVVANKQYGRSLFYWFFEADHPNASSLPVALWLNGGPGCSSIGAGGLSELGPFRTNGDGGLSLNDYPWTTEANIIFLDSPVGVGYSYSKNESDSSAYFDKIIAQDTVTFLVRWFTKFPEYKANDFYIIGESYAGHYIPNLAERLLLHNKKTRHSLINLKGFAIGNPWTDAYYDNRGTTDFFHSHSLISDETYEGLLNCDFANDLPVDYDSSVLECNLAYQEAEDDLEGIDQYDIYAETCKRVDPFSKRKPRIFHLAAAYDPNPCSDSVTPYLNNPAVQTALHVKKTLEWDKCSDFVFESYSREDILKSMLPLYRKLLTTNLKMWIYSGDVDGVVATSGTRSWIRKLNLTTERPWYNWNYNDQVGGWTQVYKGLTFATVRGAGHMVPATKPEQALQLFKNFLTGEALTRF